MKHIFKIIVTTLSTLTLSTAAFAGSISDTFEVTVSVDPVCEISANNLDFGSYDPLDSITNVGATSTIDVDCALLTPFEVGIDGGSTTGDVNNRKMQRDGDTETLDYSLGCGVDLPDLSSIPLVDGSSFNTGGCLSNWGTTTGVGGNTFIGVGLGLAPLPIVLTGTIAFGQDVPVGVYRDNPVTATVTF